nr:polysaccharide pyruvyl transferase family protein [Draconibacterium orientale]
MNELKTIKKHTDRFIDENIAVTNQVNSDADLNNIGKSDFDAFIVGSDQVWRPRYSPKIANHFLDFLKSDSTKKRISYAASFGTDNWEYSPEQTKACANLAKRFKAISVREDSAVELCRKNLGVDAIVTLDPTFLVPKWEYEKLVEKDEVEKMPGKLFNYVLDINQEKKQVINDVGEKLNLEVFSASAKQSFFETGKIGLKDCIYPPVTYWLRSFMDAEFILTDSFHGTAFSIIFNKPFISIGNSKRGLSRFQSVLKIFGLEERLVDENELHKVFELLKRDIDFKSVNKILAEEKDRSIRFLKDALN